MALCSVHLHLIKHPVPQDVFWLLKQLHHYMKGHLFHFLSGVVKHALINKLVVNKFFKLPL